MFVVGALKTYFAPGASYARYATDYRLLDNDYWFDFRFGLVNDDDWFDFRFGLVNDNDWFGHKFWLVNDDDGAGLDFVNNDGQTFNSDRVTDDARVRLNVHDDLNKRRPSRSSNLRIALIKL